MERGVDSIIYKQRGRFLHVKKGSLQYEETPSSIERRRSFHFKTSLSLSLSIATLLANSTTHAPLHSERGRG